MTNFAKLMNHENKSVRIFADTVEEFSHSQGFYERLKRNINEIDEENLKWLCGKLTEQGFSDSLDVIFFLEC